MDLSFDLVASSEYDDGQRRRSDQWPTECADQMAKYQNCVLRNQMGDWANICRPEGQALTRCADASIPHLAQLKDGCRTQIAEYTSCLNTHASLPDDELQKTCGGLMTALWECSERTMREIEKQTTGEKRI
ncbi:hypothetical protein P7C73_g5919, partial [Tremellales sp. Uapishka_1]